MNILVLNGSPRGAKGMTARILALFTEGMQDAGTHVTTITLAEKKIHHCTGEFACWFKTPGTCIHRDDMDDILALFSRHEGIVLATPVYVDGMTGLMKNCLDRMVPVVKPFFEMREEHMRHPRTTSVSQNVALLSVCGFNELDNFDPLIHHVQAICKNMNAAYAGAVLRPGAPGMDAAKFVHPFKLHRIKAALRAAGKEFATEGIIRKDTTLAAAQELFATAKYVNEGNKRFHKMLEKNTAGQL